MLAAAAIACDHRFPWLLTPRSSSPPLGLALSAAEGERLREGVTAVYSPFPRLSPSAALEPVSCACGPALIDCSAAFGSQSRSAIDQTPDWPRGQLLDSGPWR